MSPTLFGIFLAELGKRLNESKLGITVGMETITALFYADDIAIVSDNVKNMTKALQILVDFTCERNLEINYKKSLIMNFSRKKNIKWKIVNKEKKREEEFMETNEYKILDTDFHK